MAPASKTTTAAVNGGDAGSGSINADDPAPPGTARRTPLQAIRARCLDCGAGDPAEVARCPAVACANWPYRFGRDPWRKTRQ